MDAATTAVTIALTLLVACHAFTLFLVRRDRDGVRLYAGAMGDAIATIAEIVAEGGRIGADIADSMDRIEGQLAGSPKVASTGGGGGLDIRGTLATLLTEHITRQIHGSPPEQEWTIREDDPQTTPNDGLESAETAPVEAEDEPDADSS
jgi:hypothetical protein